MHLPDINVWLAITFESHVHHRRAAEWFVQSDTDTCVFCRLTQQGFLRLATNPAVFGNESLTMKQAWSCYDSLIGDDMVDFHDEPPEVEVAWKELTQSKRQSHRSWNDAYLAAFARTSGLEIVTFDKGFRAYPDVKTVILKD